MENVLMESINEEKPLIEEWVHRWGNSASEAVLEPRFQFFRTPNIDGVIGYRIESGFAIVFGNPICAEKDTCQLAQAFHKYCHEKSLEIIYIAVSEQFAALAKQNLCRITLEVGEEIILDPQSDILAGPKSSRLRNKISHAQGLGLSVHEYLTQDPQIELEIQKVGEDWLKARRGFQIRMGQLDFFENRTDKRWFYIKNKDRIMGAAMLSRLEAYDGWLLKFLTIIPEAPRGTSETLMVMMLDKLRSENCNYLTYGMVPVDHLGEMSGLSPFYTSMAHFVFKIAKWIFNLNGRKAYWEKFHPKKAPVFVLLSSPRLSFKQIRAIIKSLRVGL